VVIAIHRAVEQQAALRGDAIAYADDQCTLTYRELNSRANALARALIASGFKRGSLAAIRMEPSADLVVTLLAVLKGGGAYMRTEPDDTSWPRGVSIVEAGGNAGRCVAVDVTHVLTEAAQPSPNLPILTRGSDVACVLRDNDGAPALLVPHATIAALAERQAPATIQWSGENGALDLWVALMTGATVTRVDAPVPAAA
jgi:acyl-CoA synthetase (AMP-forming)/AMP-acid ligase II